MHGHKLLTELVRGHEMDHGLGRLMALANFDGRRQTSVEYGVSFFQQLGNQLLWQACAGLELIHHNTLHFKRRVVVSTNFIERIHEVVKGPTGELITIERNKHSIGRDECRTRKKFRAGGVSM